MSSDDGLRETEEVAVPPDVDNGVDVDAAPAEETQAAEEQEPAGADTYAAPAEEAQAAEEQEPAGADTYAAPAGEAQAAEEQEPAGADTYAAPAGEAQAAEEQEPAGADTYAAPAGEAQAAEEQEPAGADTYAAPAGEAQAAEEQEPAGADTYAAPAGEAQAAEEQEPAGADTYAAPAEEAQAAEEQEPAGADTYAAPAGEAQAAEEQEPAGADTYAAPAGEAQAAEEQEPAGADTYAAPAEEAQAAGEQEPAGADTYAAPAGEAQAAEEQEPAGADTYAAPAEEAQAAGEQEPAGADTYAAPAEEAQAAGEQEPAGADTYAAPAEEAQAAGEQEPAGADTYAALAEEAQAAGEQEPAGADTYAAPAEDVAWSAPMPQARAEAPDLPHAATPVEEVENKEERKDAAATHSPIAADDGVQVDVKVENASDIAELGVDKKEGENSVNRSDRAVEDSAAATPAAVAIPPSDASAVAEIALPPAAGTEGKQQDRASSPETTTGLPKPSPPPHDLPRRQPQQQVSQPQSEQQQRPAVVLHCGGTTLAASMSPYAATAGVDGVYDLPEAERIVMASASLTPSTVLVVFRRGHENSHVNRMDLGSYSRYLLSTDHMSPLVLEDTFHGTKSTVGAVPRNTLKRLSRGNVSDPYVDDSIASRTALERKQSPGAAAPAASSARCSYQLPRSVFSASRQTMSDSFGGTAASSTNLRREIDMLGDAHLSEVNTLRQQRRRDPRHGKSTEEQNDYIYYNHRSKGFYVPHDPPADTVMLQYNHLYGFGDGTRFAPVAPPPSRESGSAGALAGTTVHRRNPHAAPPRTFAETRGCAFPFTASQRQHAYGGTAYRRSRITASTRAISSSSGHENQPQRAETQKGSSSLRTAKAVDLGRLHCTQRSRQRTIEEVIADQPQRYLCGAEGVRGALVRDIERDIEDGKLQWKEVPPAMQKAMVSATTAAAAAAQRKQSAPFVNVPASSTLTASGRRPHRVESLAMAPSALESVMGQLRTVPAITAASGGEPGARGGAAAKIMSTAPPSPAAEAARATSPGPVTGSAASPTRRIPVGSVAAVASLPAISRLNYTPQPTKRSNPSAFV
ncbi:hypothetical protein LdCL_130012800 [Leishmania donovani]|uniref:Uncharacterized protein n=1 Tax=Leishmania donovani TaxID=5661 RepID=A0A3S7WSK5_LEIDO|nr:hypothetical protein LdCL_130012800 [Leishmania donovani]